MKVKTSELIGPALDWAVAKCLVGTEMSRLRVFHGWFRLLKDGGDPRGEGCATDFSTNWSQGGPIIEREGGTLWSTNAMGWRCKARYDLANDKEGVTTDGPTPLIAAMRCYVASRLGDEVDVPEELR